MIREMPTTPVDDSEEGEGFLAGAEERRKIGELSDSYEGPGGPEFYPAQSTQTILDRLKTPRNPDEEVRVSESRVRVQGDLKHVNARIEELEALGAVRGKLEIPPEKGDTLEKLKEAREKLEEDAEHIELASKYNYTLGEFGDTSKFSSDDIKHISETGKKKDGTHLKDKHGNEIKSDMAKKLAHHYTTGGRGMTWGNAMEFRKIEEVADRVIGDITDAVKGVVGLEKD